MNKPKFKQIQLSDTTVDTKAAVMITVTAVDEEIIFGTENKYARAMDVECYAGEGGIS